MYVIKHLLFLSIAARRNRTASMGKLFLGFVCLKLKNNFLHRTKLKRIKCTHRL